MTALLIGYARVSTERVTWGALPWRGHCFAAIACRLPVRPWG